MRPALPLRLRPRGGPWPSPNRTLRHSQTKRSEIENENDDENEIGGSPQAYAASKSTAGP
jgi:hypothetical protein